MTKYALTSGLVERNVLRLDDDGYVVVLWPGALNGREMLGRRDWAPTREAALARAEEMRAAKIASLRRQIERLESLEF
ncbi:hypothetical protein C0214_19765 [Methylobacterium sp. DM1]|nr:hypothetical protein C0214_19765 [Methylobacterium sp. DM1]